MRDSGWYFHHGGVQNGPVSFEELKEAVARGALEPTDLVWQEGMPNWVAATSIESLVSPSPVSPPPPARPPAGAPSSDGRAEAMNQAKQKLEKLETLDIRKKLFFLNWIDSLLDRFAVWFSVETLDRLDRAAKNIGHVAYPVSGLLAVIALIITSIMMKNANILVYVPVIFVVNIALHYAASLFLDAGKTLIEESSSSLSSFAVLRVFALIQIILGIIYLPAVLLLGLGIPIVLLYFYGAGVALNPESVNVRKGKKVTAGEEAIGLLLWFLKMPLRFIPFWFGMGSLAGALAVLYSIYLLLFEGAFVGFASLFVTIGFSLFVGVIPFIIYLLFLLQYLLFDVIRAILVVPRKLDALRNEEE